MSVLIKDMEMPTSCCDCFLRKDCNEIIIWSKRRPKKCPLVEVPSHGRLIDADRLLYLINDCTVLSEITKFLFSALVSGEKTVIESEGEWWAN